MVDPTQSRLLEIQSEMPKGEAGAMNRWPQAVSTDGLKVPGPQREAKPLRVFQENQGELHAQHNITLADVELIAARLYSTPAIPAQRQC